jgi:uncharacterized protein YwqG
VAADAMIMVVLARDRPDQFVVGVQRRPLERNAAELDDLVLQVDSDPHARFEWGDDGKLYLLARDEDLRAGRFDRAWLVLQCY